MQKTGAGETEIKYAIDTELSPGNLEFLPEYLRRHYLLQQKKYRAFWNIRIITENGYNLSYRVVLPKTNQYVDVTVNPSIPIEVTMKRSNSDIPVFSGPALRGPVSHSPIV